jgi:hypothetical protein
MYFDFFHMPLEMPLKKHAGYVTASSSLALPLFTFPFIVPMGKLHGNWEIYETFLCFEFFLKNLARNVAAPSLALPAPSLVFIRPFVFLRQSLGKFHALFKIPSPNQTRN